MKSFKQTQSITRRLVLTNILIATFFLLEFAGLYFSSRSLLQGLKELYVTNQIFDVNRKLRQVVTSLGQVLETQNPDNERVFRSTYERGMALIEQGLTSSISHPEAHQLIADAKEALVSLDKTANLLFSEKNSGSKQQMLFVHEFVRDASEALGRAQVSLTNDSDRIFESVYGKRFLPLTIGIVLAVFFLCFSLFVGLSITRRMKRSVQNLIEATNQVADGNLKYRASVLAPDEIGLLTHSFNVMIQNLRDSTVSRNYVESIIDSMLDCLIVLKTDGTIQRINQIALDIFGYTSAELIGQSVRPLFEEDFVLTGDVLKKETYCIAKNGTRIAVSISSSSLRDQAGSPSGIVCVLEDIRERKKAEDQLKERNIALTVANKELEAFSHSVSHDLRAPLRGIDGFSQALLEDYASSLDEQAKGYLNRIRTGIQKMGTLIDDLINLSRLSRTEMVVKTVDLSRMATEVIEELKEADPKRKVSFVVKEGLSIKADAALMRIALENLIGNAWKYTSKHPEARIELGVTDDQGKKTYFIRDDGAGFDMAYSQKLFGAFQRLHSTQEFPGTGVGLATVQRVIHRHGGLLWAESKVEQGATFFFTLPD